ncbi:hypothetical protein UCDDS831_g06472 [Diplodia seriata]|uniref:CMP/dCMP-type deaminase domain-containing protein n=1 Tax=Diplodia seriata TaxID=420778 RepID=A0A0G2E3H4_9PEZI|nr:hypothetical protein UCDDS831_g06472 [Diplodia seriata]
MTRSDHYLSLCLAQAALSPLRYRHGCIIVRGGKVIGAGHNDYRPGYDGGALKTGVVPKQQQHPKHRPNPKRKPKSDTHHHHDHPSTPPSPQHPTAGNAFTPFEDNGHGNALHAAITPFSMHSEMMAVADAVGRLRGAPARKALEGQKPRAKLPSAASN